MVQSTKDNGIWERQAEKEYLLTQRERFTQANGGMTKLMGKELIYITMVQGMKANGSMIFSMG
jgi:hypothetical protein